MLSRIRYFFEDIGYWFSDRLHLGRRRRRRGELAEGSAAQPAAVKPDPSPTAQADPPPGQPAGAGEPGAPIPPAGGPSAAPPSEPAVAAKRRRGLFRRRGSETPADEPAAPSPPGAGATPAGTQPAAAQPPAGDPSAAQTAKLPPVKRSRFGRPSISRPSLPRPHLPRPRVPGRPGRLGIAIGALVLIGAAVAAVYLATDFDFDGDEAAAPAPRIVIQEEEAPRPEEAPELGFPAFATKNTTRVAGADPIADAAGVALATAPATGGVEGPPAVSIVDEEDWPAAIAASQFVAEPIGAPILLSEPEDVPELTLTALTELAPKGSPETDDNQLFRFGDALAPEGLRAQDVDGGNPAELAAAAAAERERLTGKKPEHVVLASSDRPEFSMPAAAWSARSGDPVLFVQGDTVPAPTLEALEKLEDVPVYVLGPEPVVSKEVVDQVADATKEEPERIGEDDAVSNSIAFARYSDGTFGWNVADPGHGLVLANATRPADAGAAAPLSASGKWGPLLLTDSAETLPAQLEGYLLDIKPGYVDDPTRAVYNHAWLIGDQEAISTEVQAQVDELLELARVQPGRGQELGVLPGQGQPDAEPEAEVEPQSGDDRR